MPNPLLPFRNARKGRIFKGRYLLRTVRALQMRERHRHNKKRYKNRLGKYQNKRYQAVYKITMLSSRFDQKKVTLIYNKGRFFLRN